MFRKIFFPLLFLSITITSFAVDYETAFQQRANILISSVADSFPRFTKGERPIGFNGNVSDFGKYNYPKIIAVFQKYGLNAVGSEIIAERLDVFKDKPTFHFNLVGLPRLLFLFPEAKGLKDNEAEFLKRVFERTDSYNPWSSEGTENHVCMTRTSAYLYAQIASEKYPDIFPQASQRLKDMKEWISFFTRQLYYTGGGEFNSSTYGAYNIIGFANLYDFATDPEVKLMAKAALDYYAVEIAIHYSQAMTSGSDMRGKGLTKSFDGSQSYVGWLWFGDSPFVADSISIDNNDNNATEMIQTIHLATSRYRVPEIAAKIANRNIQLPALYLNSKGDYMMKNPSYIKQMVYQDKNFTLGSAFIPYGGWSSGNYQIVPWKLISRVEQGPQKTAQYVSGVGMIEPGKGFTGNHRSPFDQLVQHKNILVQITRVPSNALEIKDSINQIYKQWKEDWKNDFSKRFPSDTAHHNPVHDMELNVSTNQSSLIIANEGLVNIVSDKNFAFIELEKSIIVARTISGGDFSKADTIEHKKYWVIKDKNATDSLCGFVIEVFNKDKKTTLDKISKKYKSKSKLNHIGNQLVYKSLGGDKLNIQYITSGIFTEPMYDWGYGVQNAEVIQQKMQWKQPSWPTGEGHGKIASWSVNNQAIDLSSQWSVYEGPNVMLKDGILKLSLQEKSYIVNYTDRIPVIIER